MQRIRAQLRQRHGRIGAADPQHPDGAVLHVPHHLHHVGGRRVVRDRHRIDVPDPGQVLDVGVVGPVAEAGQVAVGAAFAGVLRRGLAVHLQDAAAGLAQHAADDVDVVDLHGGGGGLVGLVEALQHRGQQPLGVAEDAGRFADLFRRDAADLRRQRRRIVLDLFFQLLVAHGVGLDVVLVHPAVGDDFVQDGVHQRHVGARPGRQVHGRRLGHRSEPRIDADDFGRVGPGQPVQHPGPEHGLCLRHVVPVQGDHIGVVDVRVGTGLAVAAERFLQRLRRRRRAQPGVAVHVVGADAAVGEGPGCSTPRRTVGRWCRSRWRWGPVRPAAPCSGPPRGPWRCPSRFPPACRPPG